MMGFGGYEGFGWMLGGGGMMVMMLLVWIGPIALLIWGASQLRLGQRPPAGDSTPLEILRRRYASGEITREEFDEAQRAIA